MRWEGNRPISLADFDRAKEHWISFGWQEIPRAEEPAISAAWVAHLEPENGAVRVPRPYRCWRHVAVTELGEQAEAVEADFTLKLLAAFRRCTRPGERLLAMDWQHSCYYFDPSAGITTARREEWAMPILPDGDSYNFVAPDFRFGSLTGWHRNWSVKLFGADLLTAFASDLPERFLKMCGTGRVIRA
jgi:hypothetical protein